MRTMVWSRSRLKIRASVETKIPAHLNALKLMCLPRTYVSSRQLGGVAASYGLHLPDSWFDGHCDGCGYVGHTRADCPDKPQRKKELRAPSWAKEDKRRSSSPYGKRRESGSASHANQILMRDGEYRDPVQHEMHVRNAVGAAGAPPPFPKAGLSAIRHGGSGSGMNRLRPACSCSACARTVSMLLQTTAASAC